MPPVQEMIAVNPLNLGPRRSQANPEIIVLQHGTCSSIPPTRDHNFRRNAEQQCTEFRCNSMLSVVTSGTTQRSLASPNRTASGLTTSAPRRNLRPASKR